MKLLNPLNLLNYLISTGLFERSILLSNKEIIIKEYGISRNSVFKIAIDNDYWLIKQAYNPINDKSRESILNEIQYYSSSNRNRKSFFVDKENLLLVLRINKTSKSLNYDNFEKSSDYSDLIPRIVGTLTLLHSRSIKKYSNSIQYSPMLISQNHSRLFLEKLNDTGNFYCKDLALKMASKSNILFELGKIWNENLSLLHQDLKPSNFLRDGDKIELIDFECVGIGSFYWDLADHLYHFLRFAFFIGNQTPKVCNEYSCRKYSKMFLEEYYRVNRNKCPEINIFYRNALGYFIVKMIYKFYNCVAQGRLSNNEEHLEYNRILAFWEVIENFNNEKFNFLEYAGRPK